MRRRLPRSAWRGRDELSIRQIRTRSSGLPHRVRVAVMDGPDGVGEPFDAIVLAGGGARRLGGVDKPGLEFGGVSMLDRVLEACADAASIAVVGPPRAVRRPVVFTRED